jgi:glutathione synthase/RimK-type ligase-like ATP-grasp enzyme
VAREAQVAVRALYATLECPWISHHAAIAAAENKPRQIRLARHIGFNVPETMITNEADKAHSFFDAHEHVVTKAISYGDLGGGKVLHTSIVRKWSGEFAQEIGLCPVLLQQYIDKAYEYRVTVVDDQVFSCRIESQIHADYAVDMRRGLADPEMTHRLISLPKKVEQTCIALVKTLGLRFGAIDLAQDHDGKIWFLEINPNGQWAWIEDRTGAQISSALAEGLLTNA